MRKKSSAFFLALLTSTGMVASSQANDGLGALGPDPTHVSGANQKGAGPTGSGGTGLSATGAGAEKGSANGPRRGETSGSGTAYIDCPGNAFSSGIRNDPQGRDCVPPDSVPIQGSSNLTRDSMTETEPQHSGSSAGNSTGTGNADGILGIGAGTQSNGSGSSTGSR